MIVGKIFMNDKLASLSVRVITIVGFRLSGRTNFNFNLIFVLIYFLNPLSRIDGLAPVKI